MPVSSVEPTVLRTWVIFVVLSFVAIGFTLGVITLRQSTLIAQGQAIADSVSANRVRGVLILESEARSAINDRVIISKMDSLLHR